MSEGPLNASEMEWLEETLMAYGHDDESIMDVSELDGMLDYGRLRARRYADCRALRPGSG